MKTVLLKRFECFHFYSHYSISTLIFKKLSGFFPLEPLLRFHIFYNVISVLPSIFSFSVTSSWVDTELRIQHCILISLSHVLLLQKMLQNSWPIYNSFLETRSMQLFKFKMFYNVTYPTSSLNNIHPSENQSAHESYASPFLRTSGAMYPCVPLLMTSKYQY